MNPNTRTYFFTCVYCSTVVNLGSVLPGQTHLWRSDLGSVCGTCIPRHLDEEGYKDIDEWKETWEVLAEMFHDVSFSLCYGGYELEA